MRGKRGGISNVDTYGSNKRIEQGMTLELEIFFVDRRAKFGIIGLVN